MKRCTNCNNEVRNTAKLCDRCGNNQFARDDVLAPQLAASSPARVHGAYFLLIWMVARDLGRLADLALLLSRRAPPYREGVRVLVTLPRRPAMRSARTHVHCKSCQVAAFLQRCVDSPSSSSPHLMFMRYDPAPAASICPLHGLGLNDDPAKPSNVVESPEADA